MTKIINFTKTIHLITLMSIFTLEYRTKKIILNYLGVLNESGKCFILIFRIS